MQSIDQLIPIIRISVYIMWVLPLFLIFLWFIVRQKFIKVSSEKEALERTIQNLKTSKFLILYPFWVIIIISGILLSCKYEYYRAMLMYMILVILPAPLIPYLLRKFFEEILKTL